MTHCHDQFCKAVRNRTTPVRSVRVPSERLAAYDGFES